jgi:DNA polymerase III subunit epsilon
MNHRPLVFIDIETTGGKSDTSKIIDIGVIRVENGVVVKTMNQLIQPNIPIPYFITKLTGITNEMVWSQPDFKAIAPELELILKDALFIAHNVEFDYGFIKIEFKRIGIDFNCDRACTVKLSRLIHPEHYRHSLDKIIERMDLKVKNRHRGFDDAEVLWKFFQNESKIMRNSLYLYLNKVTTLSRRQKNILRGQIQLL